MEIENDPDVNPEDTTVAGPPATEENVESSEESEEGSETGSEEGASANAPQKTEPKQDGNEDELQIVVEGEEPAAVPKDSAAWARHRKMESELRAKNAELERKLAEKERPPGLADPGPEPTMQDCDYDEDVFKPKLKNWIDKQRQYETQRTQQAQEAQKVQQSWQSKVADYNRGREELSKKLPGFKDAEFVVQGMLNETKQGLIVKYAKNPALVVAALGQNPTLAKDLIGEEDLVEFTVKVRELEAKLKTQKKTQAPPPEKPVRGSGPASGTVDSQLERLRTEAARTGDMSKVVEYNRRKRAQQ